jgi:hypothetical protein
LHRIGLLRTRGLQGDIFIIQNFEVAQVHTCALEFGTLFQQRLTRMPRASPRKAAVESLH